MSRMSYLNFARSYFQFFSPCPHVMLKLCLSELDIALMLIGFDLFFLSAGLGGAQPCIWGKSNQAQKNQRLNQFQLINKLKKKIFSAFVDKSLSLHNARACCMSTDLY